MSTKKPSAAQLVARAKFTKMVKEKAAAKKKTGATAAKKKTVTAAAKTKKRANPQNGATHVYEDKKRQALKPGKRISANGNVYYERRANRSDVGKLLGAKK